ncbi:MAG: hypothetical protein HN478_03110 [Rhodospirillaceae bacterium]|jgi:hypothetical protein|nr:hypothetical protein [Rhodospirillaceae bacterium]MBT4486090.1 hypothetical protein [Rhodospirillaceae bacterium]MBT5194794.1 hypothetical protein [Rhodospirillaceae bacterium]MBT5895114.1 hypothetical protein [Rhodospirillaceae bacterium]MBT6429841.1 hypothetical protein [Rhodospirillaceae bacterium]
MVVMKALCCLFILSLLAANLTACDSDPILREKYSGQGILEPEYLPQPVRRDQLGNPILRENTPDGDGYWQRLMNW